MSEGVSNIGAGLHSCILLPSSSNFMLLMSLHLHTPPSHLIVSILFLFLSLDHTCKSTLLCFPSGCEYMTTTTSTTITDRDRNEAMHHPRRHPHQQNHSGKSRAIQRLDGHSARLRPRLRLHTMPRHPATNAKLLRDRHHRPLRLNHQSRVSQRRIHLHERNLNSGSR